MRRLAAWGACLALLAAHPAVAQDDGGPQGDAATVFALLHGGEWCPGPTIHVDLWSGDYVLQPRLSRRQCTDRSLRRETVRGSLSDAQLAELRRATRTAAREGLEGGDPQCIYVSNGGPRVIVIAGPQFTMMTRGQGCWSNAAAKLKDVLRTLVDHPHEGLPAENTDGRRTLPVQE